MKSHIMFYYNFDEVELSKQDDIYFFWFQNNLYSFNPVYNLSKTKAVFSVLKQIHYNKGFEIVYNIYHLEFTNIGEEWFVLLRHKNEKVNLLYEILHPIFIYHHLDFTFNLRWDYLWIQKMNYYEYQMLHVHNIYPILSESFNYYEGLAENAISYINYNFSYDVPERKLYLCHNRISEKNFFNPLNLTIDYYARDIAEYIKFLFFSELYQTFSFYDFFSTLSFNYYDFILVYARLLFPSYYFDVYDEFLNKKTDNTKLKVIISRQPEYEVFLHNIYQIICCFYPIPEVSWLKKEML